MALNPDYVASKRAHEQQTMAQIACPMSELRDLVGYYADDFMAEVYAEAGSRLEAASRTKGIFQLPARPEKRKSLGLDRSTIPQAQIGWLVYFYWKDELVATGLVRQFLPRETKCDLVIVRLLDKLDVGSLLKQIDRSDKVIELKVTCEDPNLFKRCKRLFFLSIRLKGLKLSPVAMELIFGNLDRAQSNVIWPPPLDLDAELPLPKKLSFKLDDDQNYCLRRAISRQATIIDGVVGSGKSHLAACIAYCLAYERNLKVLICSSHTGSADLISKLLIKKKIFIDDDEHQLSVVRVTDEKKLVPGNNPRLSKALLAEGSGKLKDLTEHLIRERFRKRLHKVKECFPEVKDSCGDSRENQMVRIMEKCVQLACRKTRKEAEDKVLKCADIVCCTLAQANRATVYNHKYDVLIVDDAHLAADSDLIGPLMQPGLKQIVLLGESLFISDKRSDHKQNEHEDEDENQRLFYQIVESSSYCSRLTEQYRAHEKLLEFANKHYYDNRLMFHWRCNARIELSLAVSRYIDWMPQVDSMTSIFATSSAQLIEPTIENILDKLMRIELVPDSAIMIITTDAHNIRIRAIKKVNIITVPDAVGLESDFVILSCDQWSHKPLRQSHEMEPNFILNERAFHVAITRARLGIFIVAEQTLLNSSLRRIILNRLSGEIGLIDEDIFEEEIGAENDHCRGWQKLVDDQGKKGTIFSCHKLT